MKFKVGYNHEAMTLKSVKAGDVFAESEVITPVSLDREKYVFFASGDKLENILSNGTLVTLNFAINSDAAAGDHPVTVEVTQAINVNGDDVSVNTSDGIIKVGNTAHQQTEKIQDAAATNDKLAVIAMVMMVTACTAGVTFAKYYRKGR